MKMPTTTQDPDLAAGNPPPLRNSVPVTRSGIPKCSLCPDLGVKICYTSVQTLLATPAFTRVTEGDPSRSICNYCDHDVMAHPDARLLVQSFSLTRVRSHW